MRMGNYSQDNNKKKSICPAHTIFTPRIPVNTSCLWPCLYMFSLPNCFPHSLFKNTPLYSGVLHKYTR